MTAATRKHMADIMFDVRDHVYKCHTDSILTDIKLDKLVGSNIGDFALEHEGKCHIHHSTFKGGVEWL